MARLGEDAGVGGLDVQAKVLWRMVYATSSARDSSSHADQYGEMAIKRPPA
ncbi:hypothetical protein ACWENQ_42085 [Nonomuraea sp. NPDC004354]